MKNKLLFISIFTLCIALSLTACGLKQDSTTDSKNTQTEAGSEASGKSDSGLDDLYPVSYTHLSKVAVFGFMNPVFGVILSALLLGEGAQAAGVKSLIALLLVSIGFLPNRYF